MITRRPLTRDQLHKIRSIWMQHWNRKEIPSMEEAWFEVICDFLSYEQAQILPVEILESESSVIEKGLEKDFFAALMDIIEPPMNHTEEARFILLLQATPEQRERALRRVLRP